MQNILNGFEVSSNKIQVTEFQIQVTLCFVCLFEWMHSMEIKKGVSHMDALLESF